MTSLFPHAAVDENVISYRFYFFHTDDTQTADTEDNAFAKARRDQLLTLASEFTQSFIWQRHQFHLEVRVAPAIPHTDYSTVQETNRKHLRRYYLAGETAVGDAIQDEWVITSLIFAVTTKFPDTVARVVDSDGELLLIECAHVLPRWITPENSTGRVLVCDGKIHIVQKALSFGDSRNGSTRQRRRLWKSNSYRSTECVDDDEDIVHESVMDVLNPQVKTVASEAIQRVLTKKLAEVPTYMQENRHNARCWLPWRAAQVIARGKSDRPEVFGAAVEAFYYREPTHAASVCNKMAWMLEQTTTKESTDSQEATADIIERMVMFSRAMYAQLRHQQFFPPKPFQKIPQYQVLALPEEQKTLNREWVAADIGMKLACGLELLYAANGNDQFGRPWRQWMNECVSASGGQMDSAGNEEVCVCVDEDESWLYLHPGSLEETLQKVEAASLEAERERSDKEDVEAVGGADELQQLASMFNNFMSGVSGVEGVEGNEPVQLDMNSFMQILERGQPMKQRQEAADGDDDSDELDSDDDDDASMSGDSGNEDVIMELAMADMDAELAASTMAKSFTRIDQETPAPDAASIPAAASKHDQKEEKQKPVTETTPLDLDYNLLANLLESFASQAGDAGPITNILSEMNFPSRGSEE